MDNKLFVSPSPHAGKINSTMIMMIAMLIALVPTAFSGIIVYGARALLVIVLSMISAYGFDQLFNYIKRRKVYLLDFSSLVTGFVLALTLPVNVPLYFPIIGSFIAIVLIKGCFGGLGRNIFNPSAAARVILGLMFTSLTLNMFTGTAIGSNVTSPLAYFMTGDYSSITLRSLFFGTAPGAIGTVSIMCILIAGVLLCAFRIIDFTMPLGALVTFIATTWIFKGAVAVLPFMFTGSFLFATVFMLTDPVSSPHTIWGKLVYGLLFGLFAGLFRVFFVLGETSVFVALLMANLISPLLDKIFAPRPIGVTRRA